MVVFAWGFFFDVLTVVVDGGGLFSRAGSDTLRSNSSPISIVTSFCDVCTSRIGCPSTIPPVIVAPFFFCFPWMVISPVGGGLMINGTTCVLFGGIR